MIRERMSSATILLLAFFGKNLRYFYARKNSIVLKCDWPKNPSWDDAFYTWLQTNSRYVTYVFLNCCHLYGGFLYLYNLFLSLILKTCIHAHACSF